MVNKSHAKKRIIKKNDAYSVVGVDTQKESEALDSLINLFEKTFKNIKDYCKNISSIGHYAATINVNKELSIALKTDGVGTKTFIAQYMNKFDTIGIDCIAMNVNDIICTSARPIAFLDYLALQEANQSLIYEIGKGLKIGADMAKVAIVGGETAIMPDMIKGVDSKGFDLAGMCMGIVNPSDIIDGLKIKDGDILIGIESSGIHSNGLTLARDVFFNKNHFTVKTYFKELGTTLGEELLKPTHIYVDEIMEIISSNIKLKGVAHITGDGFLNLLRLGKNISYIIDYVPEPLPIFKLIQKFGNISIGEMYKIYNMGIGMCLVVSKKDVDRVIDIIHKYNKKAFILGKTKKDSKKNVAIKPLNLIGDLKTKSFYRC